MSDELNPEMSFEQALAMYMGGNVYEPQSTTQLDPAAVSNQPTETQVPAEVKPQETEVKDTPVEPAPDTRYSALEARVAELTAYLQQAQSKAKEDTKPAAKQEPVTDDFDSLFEADPVGAVKSRTKDPEKLRRLAQDLWYEELGDKAPQEYRSLKEARAARVEASKALAAVDQERKRNAEVVQRQAQQESEARYMGAVVGYVDQAKDEEAPLVKAAFKERANEVQQALYLHAVDLAERNGGQRPPSPQEVVAAYQKELLDWKRILNSMDLKPEPEKAPAPSPVPTSIRNTASQVQPAKAPVNELDNEYLFEQAMKAVYEADKANR